MFFDQSIENLCFFINFVKDIKSKKLCFKISFLFV